MIAADTTGTRTSRATFVARITPRWDLVAVGALTVLAIVVRARGIGTTNLWLDEANSWLLTTYSIGDMLANIRHSPASPLYFLLLKLWALAWGDSTVALRSFSLLVSVPLVPLVYILGRQTVGRAAGVLAALLLAMSPLQLYFAQEARVYMLATLLSTLATVGYLGWRAGAAGRLSGVADGRHRDWWLLIYGLSAAASLYTLPLVALLYLGLGVDAVLLAARRRPANSTSILRAVLGPWLVAQVAVALVCVPLLLAIDTGTAVSSQAWRGAIGPAGATKDFLEFFLVSVHGLYFYPWDLVPAIVDKWGRAAVLRLVVVFPLAIVALVTAFAYPPRQSTRGPARALYWALLLPLVTGAVVSVWHELALTRYLLFVSPYLCVLLAAGIARAPRWAGAPVFASLIWASVYGVAQYHTILARDSDYRPTATLLADSLRSRDAVVVQPPEAGVQLAYYLRGHTVSLWGLRADAPPDSVLRPMPGMRTWLVLDYRSHWYGTPPDSLDTALGGTVVSDREVGSGERRVRLIEVTNASPSPVARGLSDTTATCCATRPTG